MKRTSTLLLQILMVLIGITALALLLWEPHLEGVNANAKFFEVYLDSFILLVYAGSIPFFVGLHKAFQLFGYIRHNTLLSQAAVNAVRTIKYSAFATAGAIVAADVYIRIAARSSNDDPAGAIALGIMATLASLVVGTMAAKFEAALSEKVKNK